MTADDEVREAARLRRFLRTGELKRRTIAVGVLGAEVPKSLRPTHLDLGEVPWPSANAQPDSF